MERYALIVAAVSLLANGGCAESHAAKENFEGRALVVRGQYAEAIPVLEAYLRHQPGGRFASRSGLFLGKAHLGLGDFAKARESFRMTIERYPDSLEAHKSRYKLALIDMLEGEDAAALESFQALARRPSGPLAPEAKALAEYLSRRGA